MYGLPRRHQSDHSRGPIYKITSKIKSHPPIADNFRLVEGLLLNGEFPSITSWNRPPVPHVREKTPLFIGFTRNWPIAYDWLALNSVQSFLKAGGWDTLVGYYLTDCDMHERFSMAGVRMPVQYSGRICDVGGSIDLNLLFRRKIDPRNPPKTAAKLNSLPEDERGGKGFQQLIDAIQVQQDVKSNGKGERNPWQYKQRGGEGEPFYRDPDGFEKGLQMAIQSGIEIFHEKWGHKECNLREAGLKLEDAWSVEHDWEG